MKVLPLVLPKYETVPWFTSGLAVLYAYDPTVADMWVTNNCISVNFNTINNKPYLHILPIWVISNCSLLTTYKSIVPKGAPIIAVIEKCVDDGLYFISEIDAFYVSSYKDVYQQMHFRHPLLVYGMDDTYLYVADHFNGNYGTDKITYQEFFSAFNSDFLDRTYVENKSNNYVDEFVVNTYRDYYTFKPREVLFNNYKINLHGIREHLCCFLNSIPLYSYPFYFDIDKGYIYGVQALEQYYHFFVCEKKERSDINKTRLLHELYTHLSITTLLCSYIGADTMLKKAQANTRKCFALRNKNIKNTLIGSDDLPVNILQELREIIDTDIHILDTIYGDLKNLQ